MHKVPALQMTVHIIAHHRKIRSHLDIYKHLTDWIPGHMCWIRDVGKDYLGEQGLRPEDFANNMISPKVPVDELGLLVIARMYHTHFGVILKDRIWTTTDDNSSKYCKFFLMYQGGVSFVDTVTGNWDLPSPPALLLTIDDEVQKEAVNLVGDKSKLAPPQIDFMLPLDMRNKIESDPHTPEKTDYDRKLDSKSDPKVDFDREIDSKSTDKTDKKVDSQSDAKVDLDPKKDETDLSHKAESDDIEMDLDHDVDSQKGDCATKRSYPKVDSNKAKSRKMECSHTNKENRASRQRKRQAASSRCLRSSESVCNKKPKLERSSRNSQKAGKQQYDLSDLIRAKGRSRTKPPAKPQPRKTEKGKKDKVSEKNKKDIKKAEKTDNTKDSDMQETVNDKKKESVNENKGATETEHAKNEATEEGDNNNKDESLNENEDSDMQETVKENKDNIVNEKKDATETENAKIEATEEGDNNNKDRKAKPLELIEPDPILKAFTNVKNMDEALELLDISDDEKPKKSIAVETKIETGLGVMQVKEYGLKPTQKKDRKFSCTFNEDCEEYFPTQGQLNNHLQTVHKASFPCSKCEKKYDTANGLNKHYHKHFKFNNTCSHCGKTFQFPKQLSIHEGSHTDSLAGKYICPTGGCSKVFLSKQGLEAHRKIHEAKEYPCDLCDKTFQTEVRRKQHQVGKHGDGTVAFCGRKFQWPDTKYKHQRECDKCKAIKSKMEDKPAYPKPIFRRRKEKPLKVLCSQNRLNNFFCKYSIIYFGTFI